MTSLLVPFFLTDLFYPAFLWDFVCVVRILGEYPGNVDTIFQGSMPINGIVFFLSFYSIYCFHYFRCIIHYLVLPGSLYKLLLCSTFSQVMKEQKEQLHSILSTWSIGEYLHKIIVQISGSLSLIYDGLFCHNNTLWSKSGAFSSLPNIGIHLSSTAFHAYAD